MVTRADILAEAETYLGVRWQHQGRLRETGIDCIGLVILIGDHFNVFPDDEWQTVNYPRRPNGTFVQHIRKYAGPSKTPAMAKEGDILVFSKEGHPCHVGIRTLYHGQPAVIHAHAGLRKVVKQTIETAKNMVGQPVYCFSFPGVED